MSYVVFRNRLPQIQGLADAQTQAAVEQAVENIEIGCKEKSRVDTGYMRSEWTGEMIGHHIGRVYNPVNYTIFNEYGTVHMGAQPMLGPSVAEEAGPFVQALQRAWPG